MLPDGSHKHVATSRIRIGAFRCSPARRDIAELHTLHGISPFRGGPGHQRCTKSLPSRFVTQVAAELASLAARWMYVDFIDACG